MKLKKEKLTNANIINAYKNLFPIIGYNNNSINTIDTFKLCSNYGFGLSNSTIDKIELTQDGNIYFYYNQNTNDLDQIEHFSFRDLKSFYNNLVDAWNEEEELAYLLFEGLWWW